MIGMLILLLLVNLTLQYDCLDPNTWCVGSTQTYQSVQAVLADANFTQVQGGGSKIVLMGETFIVGEDTVRLRGGGVEDNWNELFVADGEEAIFQAEASTTWEIMQVLGEYWKIHGGNGKLTFRGSTDIAFLIYILVPDVIVSNVEFESVDLDNDDWSIVGIRVGMQWAQHSINGIVLENLVFSGTPVPAPNYVPPFNIAIEILGKMDEPVVPGSLEGGYRLIIRGCQFKMFEYGINILNSENMLIENNYFLNNFQHNPAGSGFGVGFTSGSNIRIVNNVFYAKNALPRGSLYMSTDDSYTDIPVSNIVVSNNLFYHENEETSIMLREGLVVNFIGFIFIENNIFVGTVPAESGHISSSGCCNSWGWVNVSANVHVGELLDDSILPVIGEMKPNTFDPNFAVKSTGDKPFPFFESNKKYPGYDFPRTPTTDYNGVSRSAIMPSPGPFETNFVCHTKTNDEGACSISLEPMRGYCELEDVCKCFVGKEISYTGTRCQNTVVCVDVCVNGACDGENVCKCDENYEGDLCDVLITSSVVGRYFGIILLLFVVIVHM